LTPDKQTLSTSVIHTAREAAQITDDLYFDFPTQVRKKGVMFYKAWPEIIASVSKKRIIRQSKKKRVEWKHYIINNLQQIACSSRSMRLYVIYYQSANYIRRDEKEIPSPLGGSE
jgi:hypothetical protein